MLSKNEGNETDWDVFHIKTGDPEPFTDKRLFYKHEGGGGGGLVDHLGGKQKKNKKKNMPPMSTVLKKMEELGKKKIMGGCGTKGGHVKEGEPPLKEKSSKSLLN